MIEFELGHVFTFVLFVTFVAVGCGYLLEEWRERRLARSARRETVRCRICGAASLRVGHRPVQECPECGNSNRTGRDRRLG